MSEYKFHIECTTLDICLDHENDNAVCSVREGIFTQKQLPLILYFESIFSEVNAFFTQTPRPTLKSWIWGKKKFGIIHCLERYNWVNKLGQLIQRE